MSRHHFNSVKAKGKKPFAAGHAAGFTMVELLVVMLIGSIVATAVVSVFIQQTRTLALNEDLVDLEQNLRSGLGMLQRDVRIAGAFSKDAFPSFVIGGIDSDGNGSLDKNSDGGAGPDAIQIRYSENSGLEIVKKSGTEFFVCSPSYIIDGQSIGLSNIDASLRKELQVKNLGQVSCTECIGNCDKIGTDPPPLSNTYEGGVLWNELNTVTYFIEPNYIQDGKPLGPALMQKSGLSSLPPPYVVAFGVRDLQIVYRDVAGAPTTTLADIRRVEITLTGETRNTHSVGGSGKRSRTMTTEVQVRNLAF